MRKKLGNGDAIDMHKFLQDIKAVVVDGEELLRAGVTEVKSRALAKAKSTDRLVRSHPYETLGIVLGVGLILGLIATGIFSGESEYEED